MGRLLTAEEVLDTRFTTTQFREGYDEREVDDLLDEVVAALRHHAGGRRGGSAPLTSARLAETLFGTTRLRRGYEQEEVDALLADAIRTLRQHESGGSAPLAVTTEAASSPPRTTSTSASPAVPPTVGRADAPAPSIRPRETFGAHVLRLLRGDRG